MMQQAALVVLQGAAAIVMTKEGDEPQEKKQRIEGRGKNNKNRSFRRQFNHQRAIDCLNEDYLGPDALYGAEFPAQFRISLSRFELIMQDVMASNNKFFTNNTCVTNKPVATVQARLLLPLKTYAYGVPPHCFVDYFQMSFGYAGQCCREFDKLMITLYAKEYLRTPTKDDIKSIVALHKAQHKVDGMLASLDCTHTYWKNCPSAWKGQYSGRHSSPSIVLEAACDYNLWFWHLAYGYCGCMNDLNILDRSPLFDMMLDGTLDSIEKEAGVVPFKIAEEEFNKLFFLVDGIYPKYIRFVKSYHSPITDKQKKYAAWQEACRKDIERAFGVLKAQWQILARPIMLHEQTDIAKRATSCFILHNMLVSDRVMGQCNVQYKASEAIDVLEFDEDNVTQPSNLVEVQQKADNRNYHNVDPTPRELGAVVSRGDRFRELKDPEEYARMFSALLDKFGV
jgi:hypothetical protein